jgi:hypothetical protein
MRSAWLETREIGGIIHDFHGIVVCETCSIRFSFIMRVDFILSEYKSSAAAILDGGGHVQIVHVEGLLTDLRILRDSQQSVRGRAS